LPRSLVPLPPHPSVDLDPEELSGLAAEEHEALLQALLVEPSGEFHVLLAVGLDEVEAPLAKLRNGLYAVRRLAFAWLLPGFAHFLDFLQFRDIVFSQL